MRIKIDENLPAGLSKILSGLGHQADTVHDEGLAGRPDRDIWEAAQDQKAFLITQDLDFSDLRRYQPGSHAGVLIVRLREPGRQALIDRVAHLLGSEDIPRWRGAFVVATERKVRVRT